MGPALHAVRVTEEITRRRYPMFASLIGRLGSSTFRLSTTAMLMSLTGSRFSSESAPGPSIMGFEDEAEQSLGRPCRYTNGRSKRTLALRARALAPTESKQNRPPLDEPPIAQPRQGESSGQPKKHLGKVQTGQNFDGAHYLIPSVERTASILFRAAVLELAFVTFARSYGLQSSRRTLVQHHGLLVSSHRRCLGPLRSETGGFCDLLE